LDYKEQEDLLEMSSNSFAVVVQSYLKSIETRKNNEEKLINSIDKKPSLRDFIVKVMKCNDVQTFEKNLSLAGCTI
jgi:hypothetical protein